ncbi:hypothetical protein MRX96_015975 [Rhipicephalus microplus]
MALFVIPGRAPLVCNAGASETLDGIAACRAVESVVAKATMTPMREEGTTTNKRSHEGAERESESTDPSSPGEPPAKAAPVRRPTVRPRPNIPQDRRPTAATMPPLPPPVM